MGDHTDNILVATGAWGTVACAIGAGGRVWAKEFLDDQKQEDKVKLARLFKMVADNGKIPNREKFKHLEGDLWEFKCFQIRMGCFREGQTWFLTHGFKKKENQWRRSEVDRAQRIRAEHLARGKTR